MRRMEEREYTHFHGTALTYLQDTRPAMTIKLGKPGWRSRSASSGGSMVRPEVLLRKDFYHEIAPARQYRQGGILLPVERTLVVEASLDPCREFGVAEQVRLNLVQR